MPSVYWSFDRNTQYSSTDRSCPVVTLDNLYFTEHFFNFKGYMDFWSKTDPTGHPGGLMVKVHTPKYFFFRCISIALDREGEGVRAD